MRARLDSLVLGAGRRGLHAALRRLDQRPDATLRVVEAAPGPGGSIRTQRSNGFGCELGPFGFDRAEIAPLLALLTQPPTLLDATGETGAEFDGAGLRVVALDPLPVSFASGCEELVQACRRQLGDHLWLGRAVESLRPLEAGWEVILGGEVPTSLTTDELLVGLPLPVSTALLAGYDPALEEAGERLVREPRAMVFLGGLAVDCQDLAGYGIVPAEGVATPVVETIFCSNVFPQRSLPGRFLLRSELVGAAATGDDAALVATATAELRRWTGCDAEFPFTKVHRFATVARDDAWAECQARLQGLATRVIRLHLL